MHRDAMSTDKSDAHSNLAPKLPVKGAVREGVNSPRNTIMCDFPSIAALELDALVSDSKRRKPQPRNTSKPKAGWSWRVSLKSSQARSMRARNFRLHCFAAVRHTQPCWLLSWTD